MQWYRSTTLGQILQNIEASYLQNSLKLTYKQTILQVGALGSEHVYIPDEFREQFISLSLPDDTREGSGRRVVSEFGELPIATGSVDLLILPHVLDFVSDPHQVLREAERVLKPEGQLFVLSFNPLSIHGLIKFWPRRLSFWRFGFAPAHRLLDWLHLLRFDAEYHAAFSTTTAEVISRPCGLLQYTRASLSFAYAVRAIKRTFLVIPMDPVWLPTTPILGGQAIETAVIHDD